MKNYRIQIDDSKCVGCGICVSDCVNGRLYIENGKAALKDSGCIGCGHCYAVCPNHAVTIGGYPDSDERTVSMTEIDSDILLAAMKSRRSIRHFKPDKIGEDDLAKIIEAGRYCPTGANAQDVRYIILGSEQNNIEKECLNLFRNGAKLAAPFSKFVSGFDIDDNFFFKGAPLIIVTVGKSSTNACLASSYMEIMANSLGIGVLYSGFFAMCSKFSVKIRKKLGLKNGEKVLTCMVMGYPDVKYCRIPPRNEADVTKL